MIEYFLKVPFLETMSVGSFHHGHVKYISWACETLYLSGYLLQTNKRHKLLHSRIRQLPLQAASHLTNTDADCQAAHGSRFILKRTGCKSISAPYSPCLLHLHMLKRLARGRQRLNETELMVSLQLLLCIISTTLRRPPLRSYRLWEDTLQP